MLENLSNQPRSPTGNNRSWTQRTVHGIWSWFILFLTTARLNHQLDGYSQQQNQSCLEVRSFLKPRYFKTYNVSYDVKHRDVCLLINFCAIFHVYTPIAKLSVRLNQKVGTKIAFSILSNTINKHKGSNFLWPCILIYNYGFFF